MTPRLHPYLLAVVCCGVSAAALAQGGADQSAAERCESEVRQTIERMRGKQAQEIRFIGGKRAISPTTDNQLGVQGEGRYRSPQGTVPFSYSCAVDPQTGATSGALFRETGGGAQVASVDPAWQPDLTNFSPLPCEAATAALLTERHPRVGRISFDAGTRQLQPAAQNLTALQGRGAVQRAPGMNAEPFGYRCEFETRSGKVVKVSAGD